MKNRLVFTNKLFFLSFLLMFLSSFCLAQKAVMKGKVVDNDDGQGLPFAVIRLSNLNDSSFITGVATDENGLFILQTNQHVSYILEVQSLGYISSIKNVSTDREEKDLGILPLSKNTISLNEVTATAQRNLITKKIDRLAFNVENSTLTKGKSGWEALSSIPNLMTDNDGNISIPGKKNVMLVIDNRRINLSSQELKIYLESISAEDIVSIEIITIPPSEYDADGAGGIVNIITKKGREAGLKGNVRTGVGGSSFFNENAGITLNYNTGKFNMLTGYNYNEGKYRQIDDGLVETPASLRKTYNITDRHQRSNSGKIGLDYQLSKKHFLGILGDAGITNINRDLDVNTTFFKVPDNEIFKDASQISEKNTWRSLNINYDGLWFSALHVKMNADYLRYISDKNQNMRSVLTQINESYGVSRQDVNVKSTKIDFSYPISKGNIEMGLKWSQMHTSSDFQIDFNPVAVNLQNEKDKFLYTECIQAIYASIYLPMGAKWEFKLGSRLEITENEANSVALNSSVKRNYARLFPVGYLLYNINDKNSLNLSMGRRINRPGYFDLNPFRYYSSPYSYAEGNPFLQPSFIYNINLDYTLSKYSFGLYYQIVDNPFTQFPQQGDSLNELKYVRRNVADQYLYGFNIVFPITIKSWWIFQGIIDGKISKEEFAYLNEHIINEQPVIYLGVNNTFALFKGIRIDIKGWYYSPQKNYIYTSKNSFDVSFGIAKDFWKNRINLSFSVSDIFKGNPAKTVIHLQQMQADYNNKWDSRFFKIAASYSFGKGTVKDVKKREKSNTEETERLK